MRAREFLLEYERERAAQALGDGLWKQALIDDIGLGGRLEQDALKSFVVNRASTAEAKRVAAVMSDPIEQKKLAMDALAMIEAADPSTNKKYTQWMARMYANGSEPAIEDVVSTMADYMAKFHKLSVRKKLQPGENDINRYKSAKQLYLVMDRYEDPIDDGKSAGKAEKVYEDGDVVVIVPKDEAAACRYGRRTRWCTAAIHGSNYFDSYNKQGPLYILIPKQPKHDGEKYQLHFESSQFMNEDDDPEDIAYILKERFPGLMKFFLDNEQSGKIIKDMVEFAPDSVIESLVSEIWELASDIVDSTLVSWQENDTGYYRWLKEEGYVDDNGDVDWDRAPAYTEYNDEARRWAMDVEEFINMPPLYVRDVVRELVRDGTFDEDSIYQLEDYIAENLRREIGRGYGDDVAHWIRRNITIRPSKHGPMIELIRRNR